MNLPKHDVPFLAGISRLIYHAYVMCQTEVILPISAVHLSKHGMPFKIFKAFIFNLKLQYNI